MNTILHTKWSTAKLLSQGYYRITSYKEGNYGKLLHRLIWEYVWGKIPKNWVIHHIDGDKTNNCILNLQGMDASYHNKLHNMGENNPRFGTQHTEETKQKISKSLIGKKVSDESKQKMSKAKKSKKQSIDFIIKRNKKNNSIGLFRVIKHKHVTCKQGFDYVYYYLENNKRHELHSINIFKLRDKVLAKGLEWIVVDEEKVRNAFDNVTATKLLDISSIHGGNFE